MTGELFYTGIGVLCNPQVDYTGTAVIQSDVDGVTKTDDAFAAEMWSSMDKLRLSRTRRAGSRCM